MLVNLVLHAHPLLQSPRLLLLRTPVLPCPPRLFKVPGCNLAQGHRFVFQGLELLVCCRRQAVKLLSLRLDGLIVLCQLRYGRGAGRESLTNQLLLDRFHLHGRRNANCADAQREECERGGEMRRVGLALGAEASRQSARAVRTLHRAEHECFGAKRILAA